jgi:hypothetical protein
VTKLYISLLASGVLHVAKSFRPQVSRDILVQFGIESVDIILVILHTVTVLLAGEQPMHLLREIDLPLRFLELFGGAGVAAGLIGLQ